MSWEYKSKEAALDFTRGGKSVAENVVVEVLNSLCSKNIMSPIERLGDIYSEFDLLLDVGCGCGGRIGSFVPYFKSTIGIDPSENLIQLAKERNASNDITYLVGCGEKMPVSDKSVDLATFIFSAHYMDIKKVELELDRVLKPNGFGVFHGCLIDRLDLLKKDSDEVAAPNTSEAASTLWKKCFEKFRDYANKTNHPERHSFNNFKELYEEIHILNKSRIDGVKSYEFMDLEQFIFIFGQAIPFYKNAIKAMGFNPVMELRQDLRKLWKIADIDDKDVHIKLTTLSYIIFLEK